MTRDVSPSTTRRRALATGATLVAGATAGCAGLFGGGDDFQDADWPTFQFDAGNTGVTPAQGPVERHRARWTIGVDEDGQQWTPVVVGDTVYVRHGGLTALGTERGDLRWQVPLAGNTTPAVVNGTVYVGGHDTLYALDSDTGDEQWLVPTGGRLDASPTVVDGTVYVGSHDGAVYALDAETGETLWRVELAGPVVTTAAVVDGTVYVGDVPPTPAGGGESGDGDGTGDGAPAPRIYALAADGGDVQWEFELDAVDGARNAPVVADGTAYVAERNLHALDAETGERDWRVELAERTRSPPAVGDDRLYVRSGGVRAYETDGGAESWHAAVGGGPDATSSPPAVTPDAVHVTSTDGNLYGLAPDSGDRLWRFELESLDGYAEESGGIAPAISGRTVYAASATGRFYAIEDPVYGSG